MLGLMQDHQLLISSIFEHAIKSYPTQEIVSNTVEGGIHKYSFKEWGLRTKKLANALITEIGMVYFGLFKWKRPKLAKNEFSYHKENGILVLLSVILGVALIELFVVHLLLEASYFWLTWILSTFSAYGVIQIFGLIKSIPYTPITIMDEELTIRMGTFLETTIPLSEIDRIEFTSNDYPEDDKAYQKIIFAGHNAILYLKTDKTIYGFMGTKKVYRYLVFSVDNKVRLKKHLNNEI